MKVSSSSDVLLTLLAEMNVDIQRVTDEVMRPVPEQAARKADLLKRLPLNAEEARTFPLDYAQTVIFFETFDKRKLRADHQISIEAALLDLRKVLDVKEYVDLEEMIRTCAGEVLADWVESVPRTYHIHEHGHEMESDSAMFYPDSRDALIAACAGLGHAGHDVIQGKMPVLNEIESYRKVMEKIAKNLQKFKPFQESGGKKQALVAFYRALEGLMWEIIVGGTVFNFATNRPLIDYILQYSAQYPRELPPAEFEMSKASLVAGLLDTLRMSQIAKMVKSHPKFLEEQREFLGEDNLFYALLRGEKGKALTSIEKKEQEETPDKKEREETTQVEDISIFPLRHLTGQNTRVMVELIQKFSPNPATRDFGLFMDHLLRQAKASFNDESRQALLDGIPDDQVAAFCKVYINGFKDANGEIAFAAKFDGANVTKNLENFHKIYKKRRFGLIDTTQLNVWRQHSENLKIIIGNFENQLAALQKEIDTEANPSTKLQKQKVMVHLQKRFLRDAALFGAHQVGASIGRENTAYVERLMKNAKDVEHKLKRKEPITFEDYNRVEDAYRYFTRFIQLHKNDKTFKDQKFYESRMRDYAVLKKSILFSFYENLRQSYPSSNMDQWKRDRWVLDELQIYLYDLEAEKLALTQQATTLQARGVKADNPMMMALNQRLQDLGKEINEINAHGSIQRRRHEHLVLKEKLMQPPAQPAPILVSPPSSTQHTGPLSPNATPLSPTVPSQPPPSQKKPSGT